MRDNYVVDMKVFVPAKDFAVSMRFYEELGFIKLWASGDLVEFQMGSHRFLLQNFYNKEQADNFMMHLRVENVDAWWKDLVETKLIEKYPGAKAKAPMDYDWGFREIHLIDPSGVLWHIAQKIW